jgi:hypothetical protein
LWVHWGEVWWSWAVVLLAGGGGWMKLETASSRVWEVSLVWIFLLPARVSLYGMMG